jgi:hypothetical protein
MLVTEGPASPATGPAARYSLILLREVVVLRMSTRPAYVVGALHVTDEPERTPMVTLTDG